MFKKMIKTVVDEARNSRVIPAKDPMEEILEKIRVAQCNWRENYPQSQESPWDAIYLEVKTREDGSRYFGFNPSHQQHLNSFSGNTVEDFQNWLDGKVVEGGIIKSQEAWDELNYLCKTGTYLIAYEMQHFNHHPTEFLRARGEGYLVDGKEVTGEGFPKRMQLPENKNAGEARKLSPEMVKVVERHEYSKCRNHSEFKSSSGKRGSSPKGVCSCAARRFSRAISVSA